MNIGFKNTSPTQSKFKKGGGGHRKQFIEKIRSGCFYHHINETIKIKVYIAQEEKKKKKKKRKTKAMEVYAH